MAQEVIKSKSFLREKDITESIRIKISKIKIRFFVSLSMSRCDIFKKSYLDSDPRFYLILYSRRLRIVLTLLYIKQTK